MAKPHFTISPSNIPDVFLHSLRRRYPISSAGEEKKKKTDTVSPKAYRLVAAETLVATHCLSDSGHHPPYCRFTGARQYDEWLLCGTIFRQFYKIQMRLEAMFECIFFSFFYSQSLLQPFYLCELLNCLEYIYVQYIYRRRRPRNVSLCCSRHLVQGRAIMPLFHTSPHRFYYLVCVREFIDI